MGDPMAPSEREGKSEGEGQSRPGALAASGGLGMEEKAPSSRYAILQNHLGNSPLTICTPIGR